MSHKLCVGKLCVGKLCVSKLCDDKLCMGKLWGGQAAGGGRRPEAAGYRTKTRSPHKDVGKKQQIKSLILFTAVCLKYYPMVCRHFPTIEWFVTTSLLKSP